MSNGDMLDFSQALRELQMSEAELQDLIAKGEIRAFRSGSTMKFRKVDVDGLKDPRATEPTIIIPAPGSIPLDEDGYKSKKRSSDYHPNKIREDEEEVNLEVLLTHKDATCFAINRNNDLLAYADCQGRLYVVPKGTEKKTAEPVLQLDSAAKALHFYGEDKIAILDLENVLIKYDFTERQVERKVKLAGVDEITDFSVTDAGIVYVMSEHTICTLQNKGGK